MAGRNRTQEILEVKQRAHPVDRFLLVYRLEALRSNWERDKAMLTSVADFFPIRAVTILEVFTRKWIVDFADRGAPYTERALQLTERLGFKPDFAALSSVQRRVVTFGDIVAQGLPINKLEQVFDYFDTLLGRKLKTALGSVKSCFKVEMEDLSRPPIVVDVDEMFSLVKRMFEVRHIVVHETPGQSVFRMEEIASMLGAAEKFLKATNDVLTLELDGEQALTQAEMNENAARTLAMARRELAEVLGQVRKSVEGDSAVLSQVLACQRAWRSYTRVHAEFEAGYLGPGPYGSIAPMLYSMEAAQLTTVRADYWRAYLERHQDGEDDEGRVVLP